MVEIQFSLGAGDEVVVSATRAGYLQQDNDQCSDAADLMDAWSRANLIQTTQCAAPGQTCNGYGLVGIELSALSGEGNVYDLTTSAMPSKSEFAAPGKDENQTFYYNFCRGTRTHGSPDKSPGFRCTAGVAGVCEVTDSTVAKGLAYPCGTVDKVTAHVLPTGLKLFYTNPESYNNGRNTEVTLNCDQFAEEPVFFPVTEEPKNGPRYRMTIKTKMGCSVPPPTAW